MRSQSGSVRKRFWISSFSITALLLLISTLLSSAAKVPKLEPDVVKLLPKAGGIKDWEISRDSITYGAGRTLTDIYDGGYELYTRNGVLDAVQQMYRCKNDIAIATIHRMDSDKSAAKFLEYWRRSDRKQATYKLLKVPTDSYVYTADGSANAYLIRDRFFVTVAVYLDGEKGRATAEGYLKNISAGIEKLIKPVKPADQKHDRCK